MSIELVDYSKGGYGIPFDNKFYENYIKIHYKTIKKEIGTNGKPVFTENYINVRNCNLEDFTSVNPRNKEWL